MRTVFFKMGLFLITGIVLNAGITIANYSFEDQSGGHYYAAPDGSIYTYDAAPSHQLAGWDVFQNSVDAVQAGFGGYWTAADGSYSLDLTGTTRGGISQTVSGFDIGGTYRLTFALSQNTDSCFDSYLCTVGVAVGSVSQSFTSLAGVGKDSILSFTDKTVTFVAASNSLLLSFTDLTPGSGTGGPVLDNVRIDEILAPTPEPITWTSILLGGLALGFVRRRRQ